MRDVREIFERVLDEPQPPLRATAEITDAAHRVARRRNRLTAVGSAAAVLLAALGAGLVAQTAPVALPGPPPSVTPAASASVLPLATMPSLHDIDGHTGRAAEVLGAAVPHGLVAGHPEAQYGWATVLHDGEYVTSVRVEMTAESWDGLLEVRYVFDAALIDPACSAAALTATGYVAPGASQDCWVASVAGQPIQVTTGPGIVAAVRFLRGGFVCVVAHQGTLAAPPLTADRLAALAADPDLLP